MTTYLQLLSLDTVDSSPSVVVGTETARFLFDSGEGIQRLCVEHRTRIAKLECVYLTRLCPETVGGLPGLSLTSADAGRTQLSITGPVGSSIFWNSTNHFMKRSCFNVSISEPNSSLTTAPTIPSQKFSDMIVHCLCLGQTHLSYICETPKLAGKFDIVKALALKIPKGR
jgi:ribonuclease BN (tRNA processing enzyme)